MEVFLAAILLVALCIVGLCFNIIFRKNGHFPDTEIESNENMKRLGIKCAKAEEIELWNKKKKEAVYCKGGSCSSCAGCAFFKDDADSGSADK